MIRLQERFRTPRLLLTRIGAGDVDDMLGMHREPRVAQALGSAQPDGEIVTLVEKLGAQWEEHGFGWWAIRDPASGRFIGRGGLRRVTIDHAPEVELGYALLPEFWGQGLATELSRVSVAQGFVSLGLGEIVCSTLPANGGARRVMEKTGMRYDRDIVRAGAQHMLYRLNAASWRADTPATASRGRASAQELVAG